jgi:hypothetical protein
MAQQLREGIDKWNCAKLKVSAQQRKDYQTKEADHRMGKIFASYTS